MISRLIPHPVRRLFGVKVNPSAPSYTLIDQPGSLQPLLDAIDRVDEVFQNLLTRQDRFRLLHCRGTSTGWKARRFDAPAKLVHDQGLAAFMADHFPDRD